MLYRLRRADGGVDRFSAGALIGADGSRRALAVGDVRIDVLDTWSSPRDGTRYPSRWRVAVPDAALELEVTPTLADQELTLAVRYWEGAVRVQGRVEGRPVGGVGYVELVGYGGPGNTRKGATISW
jgi:predicted secreted hydrolase